MIFSELIRNIIAFNMKDNQKSSVNQDLAGVNIGCKKIRGFPHPNNLLGWRKVTSYHKSGESYEINAFFIF